MDVFVLSEYRAYEGEQLLGVYADLESARHAGDAHRARYGADRVAELEVHRVSVGDPAAYQFDGPEIVF